MAILRKSFLGLTAVCIAAGGAFAQENKAKIEQAFSLVMTGKKAEAIAPLEAVLAKDVSQADAFKLWSSIRADIWQELVLQEGKVGQLAKALLLKARAGKTELERDQAKIDALVAQATDAAADYGKQRAAIEQLKIKHGEFAVPALLAKVGDHDDDKGSLLAMVACEQIGWAASMPMIEALASENPTMRRNIAAIFNLTKDHRAIPALTALLKDGNEGVVTVAKSALKSMGGSESADSVALHLKQAQDYVVGIGTQGADISDVVWSFAGGKLTYKDCDAAVYSYELAKKNAEKALAIDPASQTAATLIARSYLAQCAAIDNNNIEGLKDTKNALKMVAMAMGPKTLNAAVVDSIRDNQPYAAVAAIEALGATVDRDAIGSSALIPALDSSNKMIAYAAALAVTNASRASNVPSADKVVAVLARGVAEKALTRVISVGFAGDQLKQIQDVGLMRENVVVEANFNTLHSAASELLGGSVSPDVIVCNNTLSDGIPQTLAGLLKKGDRLSNVKMLVSGGSFSGDNVQMIDATFKSEDLRKLVLDAVKDVAAEPAKVRAAAVAANSGKALVRLAQNRVNIAGAVKAIASQLGRDDSVAIPVANAIGEGGSSIDALVGAITGGGSLDLKKASAGAAGKVLGRIKAITASQFGALKKIAADGSADAGLRAAITAALGKADLSPAQRLELAQALATSAAVSGD